MLGLVQTAIAIAAVGLTTFVGGATVGTGTGTGTGTGAGTGAGSSNTVTNYPAAVCVTGEACGSIGAEQRERWVALALGNAAVKNLMKNEQVVRNADAPVDVSTPDSSNSTVVVTLQIVSSTASSVSADPTLSTIRVVFDNSMDRSAATSGIRLPPLRNAKYASPVAVDVSASITVFPTKTDPGFARWVNAYLGTSKGESDPVVALLNEGYEVPLILTKQTTKRMTGAEREAVRVRMNELTLRWNAGVAALQAFEVRFARYGHQDRTNVRGESIGRWIFDGPNAGELTTISLRTIEARWASLARELAEVDQLLTYLADRCRQDDEQSQPGCGATSSCCLM
jgi:hypothetical protein